MIAGTNTKETATTMNWIEDGIIMNVAKDNVYIDVLEARNITKAFQELSSKPLPLFVDLHTTRGHSSETRHYFASDPIHVATYSAVALFVSNPVAKVLANFFLGLNRPLKPTRLFTSKEEALRWLKGFL